jgi:hypothetical protein
MSKWSKVLFQKLSYSASQKIPYHLWNSMSHYYIHKKLPLLSTLSHMNSLCIFIPYFFMISLILFNYLWTGQVFTLKLYMYLWFHPCVRHASAISFSSIFYVPWQYMVHSKNEEAPHCVVFFSLLFPLPSSYIQIFSSTLVTKVLNLCSFLNVTDQVSHPYKQQVKLYLVFPVLL